MKNGPRRFLWWVVITLVAVQLYVIQELLAALALFAVVFVAFAALVGAVRLMQFGWERAFAWGERTWATRSAEDGSAVHVQ